ncbi:plastocyanin/azurin family copper-binding protein [Cupriavidus sp. TMH.W2]|uniref:plastocyanin/azurin family copper-binding protein n=1 Tax=Cupriavidus sp. TMH.W2 TaxID=3434465 RepID=UPI003D77CBB4
MASTERRHRLTVWIPLLMAAGVCASWPAFGRPAIHTVLMEGTAFVPWTLAVRRGDVVVWVNKDPFPHTVTASGDGFDSKAIAPGKSWRYAARKTGVFPYTCTLHPTMTGTLSVGPDAKASGE